MQPDARISIPPFVEQPDGDNVIIGNASRTCFLSVPPEAVTLLHLLADGNTIGEARVLYEQQYGDTPDIGDFLDTLSAEGFLEAQPSARERGRRYHFENISEPLARRVCSLPVLAVSGALVALGIAACAVDPTIIPRPSDLVFEHNTVPLTLALVALSLLTLFLHELAHLVAARAAGVPARMGLGTRLWILVAETDMSGIWLATPLRRCVAFLAGALFDVTFSAVLALILFAVQRGYVEIDANATLLVRAAMFVGLTRVLWQFYLFVPTDFYYVLGTLLGCKSLMHDTQVYLLNHVARLVRRIPRQDQSSVPAAEMRIVRAFAWIWIAGRLLAFGTLFAFTLPVLVGYGGLLARGLGGDAEALRPLLEGPGLPIVAIVLQLTGIVIWLRGVVRARGVYA